MKRLLSPLAAWIRAQHFPAWLILIAISAILLRLFFWAYTQRTWEDALISVLHAENVFEGIGFTHYKPDEGPVHGFTSPLSVLVPLLGELLHSGWGLAALKLASALTGGLTVIAAWLLVRDYRELGLSTPAFLTVAALLAWDHHQMLWGMAGMETQMVVLILIVSAWSLRQQNPALQGTMAALCLYARPDFLPWVLIMFAELLRQSIKRKDLGPFRKALIWSVGLYAPWIAFTTLYYGSPIPNTILAKAGVYPFWWKQPELTFAKVRHEVWYLITQRIYLALGPSHGGNGTGFFYLFDRGWIALTMLALAALGIATAIWKRQWTLWPLIAFLLGYTFYYVVLVPAVFGWYIVPMCAMAVFFSARGLEDVSRWAALPRRRTVTAVVALSYAASILFSLTITMPGERSIQLIIEEKVRRKVGEYLAQKMTRGQKVVSEHLGYSSYYSRQAIYDLPGLVSRRVVDFFRANPDKRTLLGLIEFADPDYVVFRPFELEYYAKTPAWPPISQRYEFVQEFGISPEDRDQLFQQERNIDQRFLVYRRKPRQ